MADKAILFDSSRCSACQTCVAACDQHFGVRPGGQAGNRSLPFGRAIAADGEAPLAVVRFERVLADGSTAWEAARSGCVHCAQAPCVEVCPTGALAVNEGTGFVAIDGTRCVGCHLCSMACPADAPRHQGERGGVSLCDGCASEVAEGGVPACVAACPLDALAFDDREAVVARANERAAALRDRGWDGASVLGVGEQGGHHVIQVMKYGIAGSLHESLASTGEVEWLDAAKMAGPVSVGVLGLAAAGAVAGLVSESRKQRACRTEASADVPDGLNPLLGEDEHSESGDGATRGVVEETALEAALRRRNALRVKKGSTPGAAAAAAAAVAAVPVGEYRWCRVDAGDIEEGEGIEPRLVSCGRERFGMKDYGVASGWDETCVSDADGWDEACVVEEDDVDDIPVVDELSDTGELYDVEELNRLLAEDAALAEEAALAVEPEGANDPDLADEVEPADGAEEPAIGEDASA